MSPLYELPDVPRDTFVGLGNPLSDLINNMQQAFQPKPFDMFGPLNTLSGLSNMFNNGQYGQFMQPAQQMPPTQQMGGTPVMSKIPKDDGWTLPKGSVRGVLDPLPTYVVGTGPTMASMGYTDPLPSYVKPGFKVPAQFEPYIQEAAQLYHLDPNLIKAIIMQESSFRPNLVEPSSGATGLMQLMESTSKDAGLDPNLRTDPRQNILTASKFIRHIYDKYRNWPLTLAAYNSGQNRRTIRSGQIPNIPETRNYVRRVMAYWGMEW